MNIGNISSQNAALSLFNASAGNDDSKDKYDPVDTLLAGLEESDPDRASALRNDLNNAKQTLQQLQSSKKDLATRRKEAARQKIEQIKAKILALRMMASGDPKAVARQAARLASELKSAVREYASAGGSASYSVGTASATAAATSTSASSNASSKAAATTTSTGTNTAPTEPSQSVAAAESTAAVGMEDVEADAKAAESSAKELTSNSADTATDTDTVNVKDTIDKQIAQASEKARASEEDKAFVRKVRRLVEELKDILNKAKQKMQHDGDQSSHRDIMQAENGLRDIEKSLNDISAGSLSIAGSIDITV